MKTIKGVGLWIDHKKATIVFVNGKEEEIKLISSSIERLHGQSGREVPADDVQQRVLTENLNNYYDEVILCLGNAEAILIMGAGEAKGELKKRIEINNQNTPIIDIETADKMTDRQIAAKVREHFLKQKSTASSK